MKHFNATHGEAIGDKRTKEYRAWRSIKQKCLLPTNKSFRIYGARGISVCQIWVNSFEAFLADMGRAPTAAHSIERKDNFGNYTRENCYWATPKIQARNRRTNIVASHEGRTQCCLDWSKELNIPPWTMGRRLKSGMTIAQIKMEIENKLKNSVNPIVRTLPKKINIKVSDSQVAIIKAMVRRGGIQVSIGKQFGITQSQVSRIKSGERD